VIERKWVTWVNLLVTVKGFIRFAAEKAATGNERTGGLCEGVSPAAPMGCAQ
jgi:hypothetical protein